MYFTRGWVTHEWANFAPLTFTKILPRERRVENKNRCLLYLTKHMYYIAKFPLSKLYFLVLFSIGLTTFWSTKMDFKMGFKPGSIDHVIDNEASEKHVFQISLKIRKLLVPKKSMLVNGDGWDIWKRVFDFLWKLFKERPISPPSVSIVARTTENSFSDSYVYLYILAISGIFLTFSSSL